MSNNVLIVGAPCTGKVRICQHITKDLDAEAIDPSSHSGLLYNHQFSTKYYTIDLNLLVEEFPLSRSLDYTESSLHNEFDTWASEFLTDEYKELREVLDGIILTVDLANSPEYVEKCVAVVDRIRAQFDEDAGGDWAGFVVVAANSSTGIGAKTGDDYRALALEDTVIASGFEFVDASKLGVNEFKEKLGKDRIYEVLECHLWQSLDRVPSGESPQRGPKSMERAQEMARGLLDDEDADLERIFSKLQLAKERALTMNEEDKKAYVEKVIQETIGFI